jgi:hypothetical protein
LLLRKNKVIFFQNFLVFSLQKCERIGKWLSRTPGKVREIHNEEKVATLFKAIFFQIFLVLSFEKFERTVEWLLENLEKSANFMTILPWNFESFTKIVLLPLKLSKNSQKLFYFN